MWQYSCTYMEETYQAWPPQLSPVMSYWLGHLIAADQNKLLSASEPQSSSWGPMYWNSLRNSCPGSCRATLQMNPLGCQSAVTSPPKVECHFQPPRVPHSFAQLLTLHISRTINQIYNYYQVRKAYYCSIHKYVVELCWHKEVCGIPWQSNG